MSFIVYTTLSKVAVNLQEAHEWFKNKFANLQSELDKSRYMDGNVNYIYRQN